MTTEAVPAAQPAAAPGASASPAAAPAAPPVGGPAPPPVGAKMPEGLAPKYWDAGSSAVQIEPLVKDFTELSKTVATETERKASLAARKPEDIKFEVKLPETVKVPEGLQVGINEKDPRVPILRDLAIKNGWDQNTITELVTLDAQLQIQAHAAEQVRVAAEDKKLGENAAPRKAAVGSWIDGAVERKAFTPEEGKALKDYAIDAVTMTAFEKFIGMANGTIPGQTPNPRPLTPAEVPMKDRWYGGTQQKVS